ncbi:MAG: hormogonium polysaccharide biosynthesis glycosyltransferase HpsE [Synechococcales bacterium]|nr:hormogonium polysaccharide biosynthesis glycosyltransferase HpsE [Synechococcales bacterium]
MDLDFTVAIPVYNGAQRLPHVLDHLQRQVEDGAIQWEILVIDNNSTDDTAAVVRQIQAQWTSSVPLQYLQEPRQGITYARQRAVNAAKGRYVGFLDDDTPPAADWVIAACRFGDAYPQAGAWGGQVQAEFEVPPPPDLGMARAMLAVRNYSDTPKPFVPEKLQLPPGAGLVIRRQAWLAVIPDRLHRNQRGGNDYEISLRLHQAGWQIWYNPAMKITHRIPARRLEKSYLASLARLHGLCTCELRMLTAKPWTRPLILIRSFLGGVKKLTWHLIRYRTRITATTSAACEWSFFLGNAASPFYYLRNAIARTLKLS